jgi:hypothetical protein
MSYGFQHTILFWNRELNLCLHPYSIIRFLISFCCSGENTSSSHLGHRSAFTSGSTTPSNSQSNITSTYSTQHVGQSKAPALVTVGLLVEFFSKPFSPNLNFSHIPIIQHSFPKISYAPTERLRVHKL